MRVLSWGDQAAPVAPPRTQVRTMRGSGRPAYGLSCGGPAARGPRVAQVDEHEVGVGARLEPALGQVEAGGRVGRGERGDPVWGGGARAGARASPGPGDPAPGGGEVAGLHLGRARRVVGRDERRSGRRPPARQRRRARRAGAAGRALGARAERLEVVLGEREVVGAGLAGRAARRPPARRRAAADVDDVQRAAGRSARASAASIASSSASTGREATKSRQSCRPGAQWRTAARRGRRPAGRAPPRVACRPRGVVVDGREVLDPAVAHEGLEADDAALGQLVEPVQVAGDEAAPEREVDLRGGARGGDLGVEGGAVDRRRVGVERHLDARGRAARQQRACRWPSPPSRCGRAR